MIKFTAAGVGGRAESKFLYVVLSRYTNKKGTDNVSTRRRSLNFLSLSHVVNIRANKLVQTRLRSSKLAKQPVTLCLYTRVFGKANDRKKTIYCNNRLLILNYSKVNSKNSDL